MVVRYNFLSALQYWRNCLLMMIRSSAAKTAKNKTFVHHEEKNGHTNLFLLPTTTIERRMNVSRKWNVDGCKMLPVFN